MNIILGQLLNIDVTIFHDELGQTKSVPKHVWFRTNWNTRTPPFTPVIFKLLSLDIKARNMKIFSYWSNRELAIPFGYAAIPISEEEANLAITHQKTLQKPVSQERKNESLASMSENTDGTPTPQAEATGEPTPTTTPATKERIRVKSESGLSVRGEISKHLLAQGWAPGTKATSAQKDGVVAEIVKIRPDLTPSKIKSRISVFVSESMPKKDVLAAAAPAAGAPTDTAEEPADAEAPEEAKVEEPATA